MSAWKDKLFEDKNLWEVFRKSQTTLPRPAFNQLVLRITTLVSLVFVVWCAFFPHPEFSIQESFVYIHTIADVGFGVSLGILGFLIAGFSIFASITKTELFIILAQIPFKRDDVDTGISRFQFIFYNFLNVFSVYFILFSTSLTIKLLFPESSPIAYLLKHISAFWPHAALIGNCLVVAVLFLILVEAVLRLRSFIWNLYQAVLLSIATDHEIKEAEASTTQQHR